MRRNSSVTGFLMLALTVALVGLGLVSNPASAAREKLVQGVVVDQGGNPVLGVAVTAFDADGNPAASDESYNNTDADGDDQPGYFALHVGTKGVYTLVFTKNGHVSQTIEGVKVTRSAPVVSLGEFEVPKKLVSTTTSASLVKGSITTDDKGKVEVTVKPGAAKATGDVVVKVGRKVVGEGTLRTRDKGATTITLKKLDKGTYELQVNYLGSDFHKASNAGDTLTLTVKAPKRHRAVRAVPNALAYVG